MAPLRTPPCLLWFRLDLRLEDNPALQRALESGAPVIPVYVLAPEPQPQWSAGGASRWWLHHALVSLSQQLEALGLRLVLRRGDALETLRKLCAETGARAIYANRHLDSPAADAQQRQIAQALQRGQIETDFSGNVTLLFEPGTVLTQGGTPFQVFTPYWRACRARPLPQPVRSDLQALRGPQSWPDSLTADELGLLPAINWDTGFYQAWEPTREGARKRFKAFLQNALTGYEEGRDIPAEDGTSRMSPWLHFGQVGVRELVAALLTKKAEQTGGGEKFLAELGWREFSHDLLHHAPTSPETPLREQYASFPWRESPRLLRAWQRGLTGFPIVDAGMRQLWHSGWMHNRVRMIAASVLVKHLLQPWQAGARWFWDTLVDADLAANTQGWQWSAGCGADAAPYFRVFNPVTQGERFDPQGEYVRRWVPELAALPPKYIHRPWQAPPALLKSCGISLGTDYPEPVVGLMEGRIRALAAFSDFKSANSPSANPLPTQGSLEDFT